MWVRCQSLTVCVLLKSLRSCLCVCVSVMVQMCFRVFGKHASDVAYGWNARRQKEYRIHHNKHAVFWSFQWNHHLRPWPAFHFGQLRQYTEPGPPARPGINQSATVLRCLLFRTCSKLMQSRTYTGTRDSRKNVTKAQYQDEIEINLPGRTV